MPGMKVTLNTAMRVRDVSRPSPQHEDNARAKAAEWPASRPRPAPAPPPARGRRGSSATPRPWRPGTDRGQEPAARAGGGPGKGQGRPARPAPPGTGPRPPALPRGPGEASEPGRDAGRDPARGKRVRHRRRRGQPGG